MAKHHTPRELHRIIATAVSIALKDEDDLIANPYQIAMALGRVQWDLLSMAKRAQDNGILLPNHIRESVHIDFQHYLDELY